MCTGPRAAEKAHTFTIKFNGNTNTGGSTASVTATYGSTRSLTANGFTKTGYSFLGWATSTSGSVVHANSATLTAAQVKPEEEDVIFAEEPVRDTDTPAPLSGVTEQPPQKKSLWQRILGK